MTPSSRLQILTRGALSKCPRCGVGSFLKTLFRRHERCPHCQMLFSREDGFFLGATAINYGLVCVGFLLPLLIIWLLGWLPNWAAITLAAFGALGLPVLLYRYSQCLWLGTYYSILPNELEEDDN